MDYQQKAQDGQKRIVTITLEELTPVVNELTEMADAVLDDASVSAADAAVCLFQVKEAHAKLDAVKKALYKVQDRFDKQIVPAKMDAEGVDMVRVPSLGRSFSKQDKMSASFLDKDKGFDWLRSIGQGDIIMETVNAGTLTSLVRNLMLDEGIEPPEDVVKVSTYNATGINKYTPK